MKITHMIFSLGVGGAENILIDIINRQIFLGHDVELIIINDGIVNGVAIGMNSELLNKINKQVKIFKLNRPSGSKNIYYILKLYIHLFVKKSNIIHCHNLNLGKIIYFYNGIKLLTVHDTVRSKNDANKLKYYDYLISITHAVKDSIKKYDSSLISDVIHNGIRTERLHQCNKNINTFRIIMISRLMHEKKGQDILIKALYKLIINSNCKLNVSCDFIGDGPSESYLKKLVKDFGLEDKVKFLGLKGREYVYKHLCEYDLLVQPSRYEGFGLTIVEAMSARVPVLVSNIEGPMEVIRNGELGEYFESENSDDLANKILSIVKNNNNKVETAYKYAKNNYDINRTVDKYIDVYHRMINIKIKK